MIYLTPRQIGEMLRLTEGTRINDWIARKKLVKYKQGYKLSDVVKLNLPYPEPSDDKHRIPRKPKDPKTIKDSKPHYVWIIKIGDSEGQWLDPLNLPDYVAQLPHKPTDEQLHAAGIAAIKYGRL